MSPYIKVDLFLGSGADVRMLASESELARPQKAHTVPFHLTLKSTKPAAPGTAYRHLKESKVLRLGNRYTC